MAQDLIVQRPEGLYKEPVLMAAVVGCAVLTAVLLFVDIPSLPQLISPTAPTQLHP